MQEAFVEALAENSAAFSRAGQVKTGPAGTLKIGGVMAGGIASTLADTDTSAAATDLSTIEASVTTAKRFIKHTVPMHMLDKEPMLVQAGRILADNALTNMSKDYFDFLEGLFAAAHPRAGAGAFQVGANKKYIDSALKFLNTAGGEGTQDNLLTSAFSEAALDSAFQLLLKYKSDRGVPLHIGANGGLVLVVGPKNLKTAKEIVYSDLSGSDMAVNTMKGLITDVVPWNFTTDEDDWFLIRDPKSPSCPVGLYIAEAPTARMAPSADGLFVDFIAEYTNVPFKSPMEAGIIGSNVA